MHIADYFFDLVKKGDHVYVFDGKKSPEAYGRQPPIWDKVVDLTPTTVEKPSTTKKTTTTDEPSTTKKTTTTVKPSTTKKTTTTSSTTTTEAPDTSDD
jgi:hypothetical protein